MSAPSIRLKGLRHLLLARRAFHRQSCHSSAIASTSLGDYPPLPPVEGFELPPPTSTRRKAINTIADIDRRQGKSKDFSSVLTDSFGRHHDYLRISLTEKCNLRCTYCMPEDGVPLLSSGNLLTTPEIERIAKMFVNMGVTKIRLTGGEPTVRKDLLEVVERLGKLGLDSLGMTSNGIALKRKLASLVKAGLTHLNISLDTLDPLKYDLITRRRGFEAVMETLEVAQSLKSQGLTTKINCVVIRGLNDREVPDFVKLTQDRDLTVRFIEYMPFEDNRWSNDKLVTAQELLSAIQDTLPSLEKLVDPVSDTTRSWKVPGWKGQVGFISSMSDHFCGECSRLRIGADGGVKVCLFGPPVLNIRPLIRKFPDDEDILPHIGKVVKGKKYAHDGLGGALGIAENGKSGPMVSIVHGKASILARSLAGFRQPPVPFPYNDVQSKFQRSIQYFSTSSPARSKIAPPPPPPASATLTHIDEKTGKASMVSVSQKPLTTRKATATGTVKLPTSAFSLIFQPSKKGGSGSSSSTPKGDVLTVAQLAGIMGAKHTSSLIPLCHHLSLTHVSVELKPRARDRCIVIEATAECQGSTGVEMEALMAVSIASLTVWDMCKAVAGKEMSIGDIMVTSKSGGKSGDWERNDATPK